jgi:hypothetical protein
MRSAGEATLVAARRGWRMGVSASVRGGCQVRKIRLGAGAGAALTGLCLGLLALGPALGPGYVLAYDMVFVPSPDFDRTMFGLTGTLPRAVPSDAVVTALAQALPADVVQKCLLLAIFVLACSGAARLLSAEHWLARLAAGVLYAWNPYVAERLLIGQWALLLGYASLPWVLAAVARPAASLARTGGRLLVALVPAAIGGFAAMAIAGLVALPAAICRPGPARTRVAAAATAAGVLVLLSLPWLIPSLTRQVDTSTAGVAAFAARADTPFGAAGSVVLLGGVWNAQTVPAGYGGWPAVLWLLLVLGALTGFVLHGRGRWPGLGPAAVAGLALALLGVAGPGQHLLRALIGLWPGFAVLRDGQQFAAPLALAEAAGFGLAVAWLLRVRLPAFGREGTAMMAAVLVAAPVLVLPGLAWGAGDRLRPVQYPASWLAARRLINSAAEPGSALLLPWAAYRPFGWNHGEPVLDPWPRLVDRAVIWNDGVRVGAVQLPPEDPVAAALSGPISSGQALTARLQAAGIRFVIVDAGPGSTTTLAAGRPVPAGQLAGCVVAYSAPGLVVYRVP